MDREDHICSLSAQCKKKLKSISYQHTTIPTSVGGKKKKHERLSIYQHKRTGRWQDGQLYEKPWRQNGVSFCPAVRSFVAAFCWNVHEMCKWKTQKNENILYRMLGQARNLHRWNSIRHAPPVFEGKPIFTFSQDVLKCKYIYYKYPS